jgi:4-hydroxy-2-oxoglutarate aldolase
VEVVGQAPKTFQMLTGAAGVLHPAFTSGAKGAVLALAAPLPEECVALFQLWKNGQHDEAQVLQQKLAVATKAVVSEPSIAGVKYAMDLRGFYGGLPRLPILPLGEDQKRKISQALAQFEPVAASA